MEPAAACDRLAVEQHGAISREQAHRLGLSLRAVDRRVASGHWRLIHRGVYSLTAMPASWHGRLMAAVLCGGPSALASHRSAAALWNLDGVEKGAIELSVKAGRRIRGAIVHRRLPGDDPEVTLREGIPSTEIERTLLDLAAVVSPRRAGLALDDALRRKLTTLDAMWDVLSGPKGRSGTLVLRKLLDSRDELDAQLESHLEATLLRLLRRHGLPLPVPQHRVVQGNELVARLDFAYPALRLGIEADGYRWHGGRERWKRDLRRENRLKLMGWTLLRFTWEDIHDHPETVASHIRAALRQPTLGSLS